MPKNSFYLDRAFLNLPEYCGGAFMKTEVNLTTFNITIADCNKKVELHGFYRSEDDYKNVSYKLDTMISMLINAKNKIDKIYNEAKEVKTKLNKKQKNAVERFLDTNE